MQVQVKSAGGISLIPMETMHLAKRRIFIQGEITMETACDFADKVLLLNDGSDTEHIDVFITSPGGEIQAGMLMYDVIQSSEAPIRMFCRGAAYSMAALLFASGCCGRYMLPNSELMLHEPLLGNAVRGNASSIRTMSEELMEVSGKLNRLLSHHTGRTLQEIEEACSYDHYFTARESVDFGLADGVISYMQMKGDGPLWTLISLPSLADADTAPTALPQG